MKGNAQARGQSVLVRSRTLIPIVSAVGMLLDLIEGQASVSRAATLCSTSSVLDGDERD